MKRISGYIVTDLEGDVTIESIFVAPEDRRQGLGRKLLQAAIIEATSLARNLKKEEIFIVAASEDEDEFENADLVEFYESEGFDVWCTESSNPILRMDV